jgi:thiosulfate dehydrogenase
MSSVIEGSSHRWIAALGVFAVFTSACASDDANHISAPEPPKPSDPTEVAWTAPDPATIPEGPLGDAIRRGREISLRTKELVPEAVGNDLHCSSCHLRAGTVADAGPWVGVTDVFPEYRARNAKVNLLEDRINDCFERSMNGQALPHDAEPMVSLVAYMAWLSQGQTTGVSVAGRGFPKLGSELLPDPEHGSSVYGARCAVCHGADGQGVSYPNGDYLFPPLWGPRSFNVGAGMARLDTAASFVMHNMPLGHGASLSAQDAVDVAAYFTTQPRPDFAPKTRDWPHGGKPRDARY